MSDIKLLTPDGWLELRDIRLTALRDSPEAFLSTYEREKEYGGNKWRAEFSRGEWSVGIEGGRVISLLGVTRELGSAAGQCYLEYLWVRPEFRRSGVAIRMLNAVLGRLRASGVQTVYLWVLDGNEAARDLYKRIGFVSSNHSQPLLERPGRSEEKMQLDLAGELSGKSGAAPSR